MRNPGLGKIGDEVRIVLIGRSTEDGTAKIRGNKNGPIAGARFQRGKWWVMVRKGGA
jgi:hypothetical protein